MTDINSLTVSLTKHGAHKIATLLRHYHSSEILNHLQGSIEGVNIDRVQAQKNLSAESSGVVPSFWDELRGLPSEATEALVLLGIVFRHRDLIIAMSAASHGEGSFAGTIVKGVHLAGKAYTNFACVLEGLGYSQEHSKEQISYNLESIFQIKGLAELAAKLLTLKLRTAGWSESNSLIEEACRVELHKTLSVSESQFAEWLCGESTGAAENEKENRDNDIRSLIFHSGHNEAKKGKTTAKATKAREVSLRHNQLQSTLYSRLCDKYGDKCVGTEIDTGYGTSIDVVVRTVDEVILYEIKTSRTAKACIREGLSQLLEYAYWPGSSQASKLVIASSNPSTAAVERYMSYLRETFDLPIFYEEITA